MTGPALLMYTIYRRPADLPGVEYLVREVVIPVEGGEPVLGPVVAYADTLAEARDAVPAWVGACLARCPEDDPVIVETWI